MLKFLQLSLKKTLLSFFMAVSLLSQPTYASSPLLALSHEAMQQKRITLKDAISRIEKKMNYKFAYTTSDVDLNLLVEYHESDNIEILLDQMLSTTVIAYSVKSNQIILTKKVPFDLTVKVVDQSNKPVVGAMVIIANSTIGGITTTNGEVVINKVVTGMKLEASYIGFATKIIKVSQNKSREVIKMMQSAIALEQVIVTGYQTISKERATGSYDIINKEALDKPSTNISQRLIGTTAGLVSTLDANNNINFEIRGKTSINSNSQPLVIVDGFAVEDGFNSINPNDVDNVTILKDAAAASIWGARAGNGVIVVTTKRAKQGKVNVSLSLMTQFSNKLDLDYLRPFATSSETIDFEKGAFETNYWGGTTHPKPDALNNITTAYPIGISLLNEHKFGKIKDTELNNELERLRNQDNRDQINEHMLNAPVKQQYNLNINGATDRMSNNLSLMFSDNESFFKNYSDQDYLINYKTQLKLFKWLDFNFGSMLQYKDKSDGGLTATEVSAMSPYEMLYENDGSRSNMASFFNHYMLDRYVPTELFPYSNWNNHPIQNSDNTNLRKQNINARIQAGLNFKIFKGLTFASSIQYEIFNEKIRNHYNEDTFTARYNVNYNSTWNKSNNEIDINIPKGGILDKTDTEVRSYVVRNQLNYNRTINGKHNVSGIIGTEVLDRVGESNINPRVYGYDDERMTVGSFPNGTTKLVNMMGSNINIANMKMSDKFTYVTDRFFSLYGNFSYTYDNRYTATASVRTDASNFISDDPKYRYAPFWSLGGSWNLHNEKFLSNNEWIDRLTLRTTYGYNGNVDRTTSFVPLISINSQSDIYSGDVTGNISSYGNPDLRWEKVGTFNIGTDFSFLKGQLYGSIEYYHKKATDLIVSVTMPSFNGTKVQKLNNGEMLNKGVEVSLGSNIDINNNIKWHGNLTFAYNKNEITKLYVASYKAHDLYQGLAKSYIEGYDANTLWSLNYAGEQNMGTESHPIMKPVVMGKDGVKYGINSWFSGDGMNYVYDQGTKVAPISAALSTGVSIYNFDISLIITGKFGHKFRRTGFNYPGFAKVIPNKYLSEVINGGADKFVQIPTNDSRYAEFANRSTIPFMSYLTEDASHIRFQEISLAYSLPRNLINKIGFSGLKIYAQINNVGTVLFNEYDEDPEFMYGTIRPTATYTFGLKLNF